MTLKWSERVMFHFLDLYHQHDCLWNHRTDNYRNRDAKQNALGAIVKDMGIAGLTIPDLKNKIKTIRTMYKKEHSLVSKSKKSGTGTDEIYVPKLFWYKRADVFLNSVTTTRDTSSNLNLSQNVEPESETIENEAENADENQILASPSSSSSSAAVTTENAATQEDVTHVENTSVTINPSSSKTTSIFRAPQSRKRKLRTNDNISNISSAIDKLQSVVQNNKTESDDECDIFAKYIAVQLKKMPLYDSIVCQEQIQAIIRQKRLELLARQSQAYTTPPPAFSPCQYNTTSSPGPSNVTEGEYWSSSVSSEPCEEILQESSDILTQALTNILH